MGRSWSLVVSVLFVLEMFGVMSYIPEPLPAYNNRQRKPSPSPRDDSIIHFPSSETQEYEYDSRHHTGSKRSLPDTDNVPVRFSDLYPQTSFFNAERPVRVQATAHGPQNGWGNPPAPWGNSGFNNPPRQSNRPNSFPSNQPNRESGGTRQWGNGGGNFNRPTGNDYDEEAFVFDRPPSPGSGSGGGGRPQVGGGGRPRPGNGGVTRPQTGNGGVTRPQSGNGGGGGGRPKPPTAPPLTVASTARPAPGAPVTAPTPAPTRPGCNCPSTPEFNPVCGQDRVTYSNPGKLRCANACGNNVMMLHFGACITTTTPSPSR